MAIERIETQKFAGVAGTAGAGKKGTIVAPTGNAGECDRALTSVQSISCTANGTTTLTSAALFGPVFQGMTVTGPGVPANTTVTNVASTSSLTVSNAVTAGAEPQVRTFSYFSKPLGVLVSDASVGDNVGIGIPRPGEFVKVIAGAAITLNSFCEVGDTSGRIISSTTTPAWVNNVNNGLARYSVGFASEAAGAANDVIIVRWSVQLIATS